MKGILPKCPECGSVDDLTITATIGEKMRASCDNCGYEGHEWDDDFESDAWKTWS